MDDNKHRKYYDSMLKEKNEEIVRLADDNRRYRDIYLKKIGLEQNDIDTLTASQIKGE